MTVSKLALCAVLSAGLATPLASVVHAQDAMMKKDGMKRNGMMKHDDMKKGGMMKHDGMKKGGMMKGDSMQKDQPEQ